jgi:CBS domain-containing protein
MGVQQSQRGMKSAQIGTVALDEIIQTDVVTATEDTKVMEVIERLADEDVGSVIVVDDEEKPLGIITDRKIALQLRETPDIVDKTAAKFVDGSIITGEIEMSVLDAVNELSEASIRRLPIVDEDGTLVGIVTLDDILVLLAAELDTAADIIKAQSPRL